MALKNTYSGTTGTFDKIQKILAENGARKVMFDYGTDGRINAITFQLEINNTPISFHFPALVENVEEVMFGNRRRGGSKYGAILEMTKAQKEQAYKTAWANIRDLIDAQMALIRTRQVQNLQIFLAFAVGKNDQTFYQKIMENPTILLGDGK